MFNAQYFRTFITLVETGSFTHTARKLEMTQPGVSQHIRKLEQYLGRSLLDRQDTKFSLTAAGRRCYDYSVKLFAEHTQFMHSLDDDSPDSGECRVASPSSVGLMFYPFTLGYQQQHPGLTVSYSFAFNSEIVQDVLAGRFDLRHRHRAGQASGSQLRAVASGAAVPGGARRLRRQQSQ